MYSTVDICSTTVLVFPRFTPDTTLSEWAGHLLMHKDCSPNTVHTHVKTLLNNERGERTDSVNNFVSHLSYEHA